MLNGGVWIDAGQLLARLLRRELPFDARAGRIALALPCHDFTIEGRALTNAPIQTLPAQHADLDLTIFSQLACLAV